jgi:hypothetical protein
MPCTYLYRHSSAQRNSIYHAQHAPLLRTHVSRLYTALTQASEVWSCEQVLQQCAALPYRLWSWTQGCMHMCV